MHECSLDIRQSFELVLQVLRDVVRGREQRVSRHDDIDFDDIASCSGRDRCGRQLSLIYDMRKSQEQKWSGKRDLQPEW